MKRVLTALCMIPPVLYVVIWGPAWLVLAVTALVAALCYHEYAGIAAAYGFGNPGPLGLAAGLALLALPLAYAAPIVLALTLAALAWNMRLGTLAHSLPRTALLVLGVVYVFGCWKSAPLLRAAGAWWLLYGLALSWVGDIGAYYVGRKFGRHKLAPRISPGKSREGAAASVAVAVAFGYTYLHFLVPAFPAAGAVALSAAANVAGQLGDLVESALKRGAGVKDSGTLLPGHGGFLDRVDSSLFVLPVVYLALQMAA